MIEKKKRGRPVGSIRVTPKIKKYKKAGRPVGTKTKTKDLVLLEKKEFLRQLELVGGCVGEALKNIGFSYTHLTNMIRADVVFKAQVEELKLIEPYIVETELLKQIKAGNTQATIYYMKTKGRIIGYGDDKKLTIEQVEPIKIIYQIPNIVEVDDDFLMKLKNGNRIDE